MPGPAPSPTKARRNKSSTRATLSADHDIEAPPLPESIDWHPLTVRWWQDLWDSPMATEYVRMDVNGLLRVAMLYNDFWIAATPKERAEAQVRLEKADADYGTNPLARRRLEWQIEETEDKQARGNRRRATAEVPVATPPPPGADPRLKLVASE